ncbi:MAG TPA: DUF4396 domain-containing protein [Pseudogracilibacillus sp.]|nr:DUF4396 domain-containing protein [Pseudogracilibacillus sp.]
MLNVIAWVALIIGLISSLIIIFDIIKHPQQMFIMNLVWPINGWFLGPIAIWTYFKWGRIKAKSIEKTDSRGNFAKVFVSTSHCSVGCTAGDALGVPIIALTSLSIAGSTLLTHYTVEFILAYTFGIIFQFYAIYPMDKSVGIKKALKSAIKADTLSLIAFEVGMFGWMALVQLVLFVNPPEPNEIVFWFMMQIAMILGFLTSYPANWWLVKKGIKEAM